MDSVDSTNFSWAYSQGNQYAGGNQRAELLKEEQDRISDFRKRQRELMIQQRQKTSRQNRLNNQLVHWSRMSEVEKIERRRDTYLRRSIYWHEERLAKIGWKAKKIIGQGIYGICTLFGYEGPIENKPPDYPMFMVSKQSAGDLVPELLLESQFLQKLNQAGSHHMVKIFGSINVEPGTGTHPAFDSAPISTEHKIAFEWQQSDFPDVARIYLEYCQRGTLWDYRQDNYPDYDEDNTETPPELDMWKIWQCLAKGLVVLAQGHEDENQKPPDWNPIIHFDLKCENIFVSDHTKEHPHSLIFKLGDLGMGQFWPGNKYELHPDWLKDTMWRNIHKPPEQLNTCHPKFPVGMKTDIWVCAAMIYLLIFDHEELPYDLYPTQCGPNNEFIHTIGGLLMTTETKYSNFFKRLMFQCLAENPDHRPDPNSLVRSIEEALKYFGEPSDDINPNADKGRNDPRLNPSLITDPDESRDPPLSKRVWSAPSSPRFERGPKIPIPDDIELLNLYGQQEPKVGGSAFVEYAPLPVGVPNHNETDMLNERNRIAAWEIQTGRRTGWPTKADQIRIDKEARKLRMAEFRAKARKRRSPII